MSFPLNDRSSTTTALLNETSEPNFEDQHEDLEQRRSDSHDHGKHSKWIQFPFRRIIEIIIGIIIFIVLVSTIIGSVVGIKKYNKLVFPHSKVHASKASLSDGSKIVRPFFEDPKSKFGGAASKGTLVVKLWFREGPEPFTQGGDEPDWSVQNRWFEERERINLGGEQGFMKSELGIQNNWEEVWSKDFRGLDIEGTRRLGERVTIPGNVVHSLITNNRSSLVSTFQLLPTPSSSSHNNKHLTYKHTSTRPVDLYGPDQPWPLSYTPIPGTDDPNDGGGDTDNTPFNAFLAHSAVGQSIHSRIFDNRGITSWEDRMKATYANFINTKMMITIVSDYSVYGLEGFRDAMDALRVFKQNCANQEYYWGDCYRTFENDGHFENLLSIQDESGNLKEWKYGPFLTTRVNPSTVGDYVELPKYNEDRPLGPDEVEDFTFNWQLTYSSLSPAKISMARLTSNSEPWRILNNDGFTAMDYDNHEFRSALLGLSFNPESRPIARGFVYALSTILRYLASPFILHYWLTRKVSTGITLIPLMIQSIVDLTSYIVISVLTFEDISILIFIIIIISFVVIILKQLHLFGKPEFMLSNTVIPGIGIMVPLPTAVRFRSDSVEEKQNYKEDWKLDWKLRVLLGVVTFCLFRFAPSTPHIVSAPKYSNVMQGFGGAIHYDPTALSVLHLFNAIQSSFWLISQSSQIHLNYRNQTFGGSHKITIYLSFTSLFLSHITKIFVGWFGRSQLMQPFSIWDLVSLIISGVMVIQAVILKPVDQDVNDVID